MPRTKIAKPVSKPAPSVDIHLRYCGGYVVQLKNADFGGDYTKALAFAKSLGLRVTESADTFD